MIELIVEDYCQNCPEFEPECVKYPVRSWDDGDALWFTRINCKYAERCKAIEQYFSKLNDKR